jgi:hypothetical protein
MRYVADELHRIEANLSTGNMDFSFYAESADATDGVFRGGGPARSVIKAVLERSSPGNVGVEPDMPVSGTTALRHGRAEGSGLYSPY